MARLSSPLAAIDLQRRLAGLTDTWQRLKPWVRTTIRGLGALAVGLGFGWPLAVRLLPPAQPPQPQGVTIVINKSVGATVAVPPPPSGDASGTQATPIKAAPTADNLLEFQLRQMINTKIALHAAPLASLVTSGPDGSLPRIADDGTEPWRAYSRPQAPPPQYNGKPVPQIAVVLVDAGLSQAETNAAIATLPGQVDMAFNLYSVTLPAQINAARAAGHEALLDVPMEPVDYPQSDPGPETLMSAFTSQQNLRQLLSFLSRSPGVFAITSSSGSAFLAQPESLEPVLQELKRRGLAWVDLGVATDDSGSVPSVGVAGAERLPMAPANPALTVSMDASLAPARLQAALDRAVDLARAQGQAVILAHTYPLSVATLNSFILDLPARHVALVPVSALLATPKPPANAPIRVPSMAGPASPEAAAPAPAEAPKQ